MKELHFDVLDKLYNSLRRLQTARHLKPNPANRNIPQERQLRATEILVIVSLQFS